MKRKEDGNGPEVNAKKRPEVKRKEDGNAKGQGETKGRPEVKRKEDVNAKERPLTR